jgi:hypothetical protein
MTGHDDLGLVEHQGTIGESGPMDGSFPTEAWLRFSRAVTFRVTTVVGAGALAALAFSQGSQAWAIVGAVLTGSAIADVILLIVVAWFNWRHRAPRSRDVVEDQPRPRNTL